MGQGTGLVYLLHGNVLATINTGTTLSLTPVATISNTPAQTAADSVGLAGGVDPTNGPFLWAFFETTALRPRRSTRSMVARADAGRSHDSVVQYLRVAAGTSSVNASIACYGSVNLYCTSDGGATFNAVNDWTEYYANPASKLHADISFDKCYSAGGDLCFIGTDGGIYETTGGSNTVSNDNLNGMDDSQYYGSYTGRNPPYSLAIGAQDQGYQNSPAPSTGVAP